MVMWGRGGPLDEPPVLPQGSPYADYASQYRALNDAWYDAWLSAPPPVEAPPAVPPPEVVSPVVPSLPPSGPYGPAPGRGEGGLGQGPGYGGMPGSGTGSLGLGGIAEAPVESLFGTETFTDLEPGMFGLFGTTIGTGITPTGELHNVAMFDPAEALVGLATAPLGPIASIGLSTLAGYANPVEVPLGSLGHIANFMDVMRDPTSYSTPSYNMAAAHFAATPPQLDIPPVPGMVAPATGAVAAATGKAVPAAKSMAPTPTAALAGIGGRPMGFGGGGGGKPVSGGYSSAAAKGRAAKGFAKGLAAKKGASGRGGFGDAGDTGPW